MPLKPTTAMHKDRRTGKDSVRMQHRHFAFIAGVIGTSGERSEDKRRWANYFAQELEKTNPNFDRARFFTAVGVDDPYVTQAAYPDDWTMSPDGEYFTDPTGKHHLLPKLK